MIIKITKIMYCTHLNDFYVNWTIFFHQWLQHYENRLKLVPLFDHIRWFTISNRLYRSNDEIESTNCVCVFLFIPLDFCTECNNLFYYHGFSTKWKSKAFSRKLNDLLISRKYGVLLFVLWLFNFDIASSSGCELTDVSIFLSLIIIL